MIFSLSKTNIKKLPWSMHRFTTWTTSFFVQMDIVFRIHIRHRNIKYNQNQHNQPQETTITTITMDIKSMK